MLDKLVPEIEHFIRMSIELKRKKDVIDIAEFLVTLYVLKFDVEVFVKEA